MHLFGVVLRLTHAPVAGWLVLAAAACGHLTAPALAGGPVRRLARPGQPQRIVVPAHSQPAVDQRPLAVGIERAFPQLKFRRPVLLTHAGDGSNRLFVASQLGEIHVFPNQNDVAETQVFLDLTDKTIYKDQEFETGVLGLAFHPKFKENGQFFVYYTVTNSPYTNVVSRFRVSQDDPNRADPDSGEELLRMEKPFWNHNAGTLTFGPDGYLYIATGDGGKANDPYGNGQNLQSLLGKVLRIDVDHPTKDRPYGIPADNPFLRQRRQARPEIWAYGLRNPWRIAFDRSTGKLWCADVGQDLWEEIDILERGGNYGWNLREGQHEFGADGSPPRNDLVEPIWEYPHSVGKSITGGFVYRGRQVPELQGAYLYADFVAGKLWALWYDGKQRRVTSNRPIAGNTMPVMSFGEDEAGEAYFTLDTGQIQRFVTRGGTP